MNEEQKPPTDPEVFITTRDQVLDPKRKVVSDTPPRPSNENIKKPNKPVVN